MVPNQPSPRKHKKGLEEDVTKKRTRRAQKFQRAVVGATLQDIMAKRNQKPEVRREETDWWLMMINPHANFNHVPNIHSYSEQPLMVKKILPCQFLPYLTPPTPGEEGPEGAGRPRRQGD